MDGNLCQNSSPNLDWANVGGQPVASDGFNDLTQFTQGAKENNWPWSAAQVNPNSSTAGNSLDIGNVYAFTQTVGGHVYAYFGFERDTDTGSAAYYVELNQKPNTPTGSPPTGPVPNRTTGDLRLAFDQGGDNLISLAEADAWSPAGCSSPPGPATTQSWCPISNPTGFTGTFSQNTVHNLSGTSLSPGTFAEVAIDLTALFAPAGCSGNYDTVNLRSASSPSPTSSLGDWIQPVAMSVPSTCTTTTASQVINDATRQPPSGTETTGASFHDTATVGVLAGTATGTVTYKFFPNGTCTAPASTTQNVNLRADGTVPDSTSTGPLGAGLYSFQATYNGDATHNPSTSACEPFTVTQTEAPTDTQVMVDGAGPPTGNETAGTSFHDTATVEGVTGVTPTGTVTYSFFTNGSCTALVPPPPPTTQTVTLDNNGLVPPSASTGPLNQGDYSFQATYSGDGNYGASTSPCEPFIVAQASTTTATTVRNAAPPNPEISANSSVPLGSSVFDSSTVAGQVDGQVPGGSVTYTLFPNSACTTGTGSPAGGGPLDVLGVPPDSDIQGPLGAGSYSFEAVYSGDSNYTGSTGPCEPFTVVAETPLVATLASPNTGTVGPPLTVSDSATVFGNDGFVPTGTVTFTLWTDSSCTTPATELANPSPGDQLSSNGTTPASSSATYSTSWTPPAPGVYYWTAVYSGEPNYSPATSACGDAGESIVISKASPTITTAASPTTGTAGVTMPALSDIATFHGTTTTPPTGSVTFTLYSDAACTVAVSGVTGSGPISSVGELGSATFTTSWTPPAPGTYRWIASYSGDGNNNGFTTGCGDATEEVTIAKAGSTLATVAFDPATEAAWSKTETTGASAFDTATVTGVPGITPTGRVTYTFFHNDACTPGTGRPAGTVTLTSTGAVPNSDTVGPLGAGVYAFNAVYSGDTNYAGMQSDCEPFSVAKAGSTAATTVFDASTNKAMTGTAISGTSAFDTATVTGAPGVIPTGTVIYTFFANGTCSALGSTAETVMLTAAGAVPNSATHGPLAAGSYSFQAVYSGDASYQDSTSVCEPFSVDPAPPPAPTAPITDVTVPVTG
jgi:hypothetical protein